MIENTIKLCSRGNETNILKLLKSPNKDNSDTYVLKTKSPISRAGYIGRDQYIGPPGGALIIENSILKEANRVVKKINYIIKYGYTITFK